MGYGNRIFKNFLEDSAKGIKNLVEILKVNLSELLAGEVTFLRISKPLFLI